MEYEFILNRIHIKKKFTDLKMNTKTEKQKYRTYMPLLPPNTPDDIRKAKSEKIVETFSEIMKKYSAQFTTAESGLTRYQNTLGLYTVAFNSLKMGLFKKKKATN